jgi:Family of unknown function (DUF6580)
MWLAVFLIAASTAYRLVAHPYNVAPIDAMFLLSALYLPRRGALAWAFPFAAVILSDVLIYYQWDGSFLHFGRLIDYAAFALIGLLGLWAKHRGVGARVAAVSATPVIFFLVSNFGVWLAADYGAAALYSRTLDGLLACYLAGLPFFKGTIVGDLIFAGGGILLIESARHSRAAILRRLSQPT